MPSLNWNKFLECDPSTLHLTFRYPAKFQKILNYPGLIDYSLLSNHIQQDLTSDLANMPISLCCDGSFSFELYGRENFCVLTNGRIELMNPEMLPWDKDWIIYCRKYIIAEVLWKTILNEK